MQSHCFLDILGIFVTHEITCYLNNKSRNEKLNPVNKIAWSTEVCMTGKSNAISLKFPSIDIEPRALTPWLIVYDVYCEGLYRKTNSCLIQPGKCSCEDKMRCGTVGLLAI